MEDSARGKDFVAVDQGMNRRLRILVADDDTPSVVLASDILRAKGYEVLTASDGQEAVTLATVHRPALILMDMQMPLMSGIEATSILKNHPDTRTISIVAMTASAMRGDEERLRQAGCDAYLAKPTTPSQILRVVRQCVSGGKRTCLEREK